MTTIPEKFTDLFTKEKKAFVFLALVMKNGAPQVTPVWFDYDDTHIIINTARGRVKDKILKNHPTVAMAIPDPANPYRYVQVRGKVIDETEVGGYEMICQLNQKYHGKYEYPKRPGEVRVTYKILIEHISHMG